VGREQLSEVEEIHFRLKLTVFISMHSTEEVIEIDPEEYTVTSTGNIVSRKSELHASTKIRVHPKVH
jgi:hypothetical protein